MRGVADGENHAADLPKTSFSDSAARTLKFMRLTEARKQCHYAVQLNTYLTRAFVPAQPDDEAIAVLDT
jgi:hypothetical protein